MTTAWWQGYWCRKIRRSSTVLLLPVILLLGFVVGCHKDVEGTALPGVPVGTGVVTGTAAGGGGGGSTKKEEKEKPASIIGQVRAKDSTRGAYNHEEYSPLIRPAGIPQFHGVLPKAARTPFLHYYGETQEAASAAMEQRETDYALADVLEAHPPEIRATPSSSDTLPPFFPPKATSTENLHNLLTAVCRCYEGLQGKGPTMRQLDKDLTEVLLNKKAGYENVSHYWLEGKDDPGFALATHIEFIDDLGNPVLNHRFDTGLPTPDWFSGWEFLKALVLPRNGRYRLIALVVAQRPLREKPNEMTHEQVEEINHGPSGLSENDWADLEVNPDYYFTAYIYEFYRKTRSEPITVMPGSGIQPSTHLASIHLVEDIEERMKVFPHP